LMKFCPKRPIRWEQLSKGLDYIFNPVNPINLVNPVKFFYVTIRGDRYDQGS